MDIFDKLIQASSSTQNLDAFLRNHTNSSELYDFLITQSFENLSKSRQRIEDYILSRSRFNIYKLLDFSDSNNATFIVMLLDVSERFSLLTEFQQLCRLTKIYKFNTTSRLEAASEYLININYSEDYSSRMDNVLKLLKKSLLFEEDDNKNTIRTLINFYFQVFYNLGEYNAKGVIEFRSRLISKLSEDSFLPLFIDVVKSILALDITDFDKTKEEIQNQLDNFLNRTKKYLPFKKHQFLIEENSKYSRQLSSLLTNDFLSLREISSDTYDTYGLSKSKSIFYSLQRGVEILKETQQLVAYIHSYGKMHNAKILSTLEAFQKNELDEVNEIYDWGCGQGLASYIVLEQHPLISTSKVTLIEPSEIALRRGALHIQHLNKELEIITINSDLNSLVLKDFNSKKENVKLHLFSNILDIDAVSLQKLTSLIKDSFSGTNYFICVSPYINIMKTNRLNNFVSAFENNEDFEILKKLSEKKGSWLGTNWSRVIRVFKVNLD